MGLYMSLIQYKIYNVSSWVSWDLNVIHLWPPCDTWPPWCNHVMPLLQLVGPFVLGWCEKEGADTKRSTRSSRLHLVWEIATHLSKVRYENCIFCVGQDLVSISNTGSHDDELLVCYIRIASDTVNVHVYKHLCLLPYTRTTFLWSTSLLN